MEDFVGPYLEKGHQFSTAQRAQLQIEKLGDIGTSCQVVGCELKLVQMPQPSTSKKSKTRGTTTVIPAYLKNIYREQTVDNLVRHGWSPDKGILKQLFTEKELFKLSLEFPHVHKEMNK